MLDLAYNENCIMIIVTGCGTRSEVNDFATEMLCSHNICSKSFRNAK